MVRRGDGSGLHARQHQGTAHLFSDGGERFHLTSRVLVRLAVLHVDDAYNAVPSDHWSGQKGFITVFS